MKKAFIILFFVSMYLLPAQAYSQYDSGTPPPSANDSLYIKAITEYTIALEREPKRSIGNNAEPKTLFLVRCTYLFDLPAMINGYKVIVLWPSFQEKYFKENNGRLVVLDLLPLALENGKFCIDIKQSVATLDRIDKFDWIDGGMGVASYFNFKNGKMVFDHAKVDGAYYKR